MKMAKAAENVKAKWLAYRNGGWRNGEKWRRRRWRKHQRKASGSENGANGENSQRGSRHR
jgi:hypothetical protein